MDIRENYKTWIITQLKINREWIYERARTRTRNAPYGFEVSVIGKILGAISFFLQSLSMYMLSRIRTHNKGEIVRFESYVRFLNESQSPVLIIQQRYTCPAARRCYPQNNALTWHIRSSLVEYTIARTREPCCACRELDRITTTWPFYYYIAHTRTRAHTHPHTRTHSHLNDLQIKVCAIKTTRAVIHAFYSRTVPIHKFSRAIKRTDH